MALCRIGILVVKPVNALPGNDAAKVISASMDHDARAFVGDEPFARNRG